MQHEASIGELGGYHGALPIPNSFDHGQELTEYSRTFFSTAVDGITPPEGRWTSGPSLDGKGEYRVRRLRAMGEEPQLAPPIPQAYAQVEEVRGGEERVALHGQSGAGATSSEGIVSRLAHAVGHVVHDPTGGHGPDGHGSGTR